MNTILVPERLLTNGSAKNGMSTLIYHSDTTDTTDTTDTNYSEMLVSFRATSLLNGCDSRKVFIIISHDQNFKKTQTIFIRLSCFCQDQFTRSNFYIQSVKIQFSLETYSLVSDDFCNLSATRVFVGTNGECKKYKKC